jgi:hypothetical protein
VQARRLPLYLATLIGTLIALTGPALWNRSPFYYYDTRTYVRSADAAIYRLTGVVTEWTATDKPEAISSQPTSNGHQAPPASHPGMRSVSDMTKKGVTLGRSPYYGLLLYLGVSTGGFWLTVFLQAAAALLTVYLGVRAFGLQPWPDLPLIALALCVFSDLPFFSSFLMPDLFAGIAILACALLIASPSKLERLDYGLLVVLLATAMLFHDSCIAVSLAMLTIAVAVMGFRRSFGNWRGPAFILLALAISFAGQSMVAYGIKHATHQSPLRLPFLSARLIADGPGTDYLRATCPNSAFALCDYVSTFPIPETEFLFGDSPGHSVYDVAGYERRREISSQELRFVLAVLRYDPMGVGRSAARNFAEQLTDFGLSDFSYRLRIKIMDGSLPPNALRQVKASRAYLGTLHEGMLTVAVYISALLSFIFLLLVVSKRRGWKNNCASSRKAILWVLVGVVLNAAICGCLSGVDDRYQARVIWLLPLVSLLCAGQIVRSYLLRTSEMPESAP